jgi:drug/metabolite transporter (DMT)-like permease
LQLIINQPTLKHAGELAALLTAFFWTVTALAFEASGKRVGSMVVNLFRLILGFVFLSLFAWFYRGLLFPVDATPRAWLYLILSGLIGFVFGDLCLFQAFVVVGARISMLIMSLSPLLTALGGWIFLGELLPAQSLVGMGLTISGVVLVALRREDHHDTEGKTRKIRLNYPFWGILLAFGGAVGQAAGLIISKSGMQDYDAFASSQIRIIAGIAGFAALFFILKLWRKAGQSFSDRKAMAQISVGAFFGPFLGVSFSLLSVQLTSTGIASTIMSIVPVLIIPASVFLFKEKVKIKEIIGAVLAVSGTALFFL